MPDLRIKKLTVKNWLKPDSVMSYFIQVSGTTSEKQPVADEDWVEKILEPELSEKVPIQIHALFEVARGALVLIEGQGFRLVRWREAGSGERYSDLFLRSPGMSGAASGCGTRMTV